MKSIFKPGFMYKFSCAPDVLVYIAESKTLAGKEVRDYEGEALGRKLSVSFFQGAGGIRGLVVPVDPGAVRMQLQLLTIAEILQALGGVHVDPDPSRAASDTELLFEALYENIDIRRLACRDEPEAPRVHTFEVDGEIHAEAALAEENRAKDRTKMMYARCLQRHGLLVLPETLAAA